MPPWTPIAGWMSLAHLDDGEGLDGAYVIAFKVTDDGGEKWSARMNRFKAKDRETLYGFAACLKYRLPPLLGALGIDVDRTVLVPAISSRDTVAQPGAFLSLLTQLLADRTGARFEREAVRKQPHQPIHGIYNASGRTAELDKANYTAASMPGVRHVVILDDFITRGGTLSRMAKALKDANPRITVQGVALGKTERRGFWGAALTNEHVEDRWEELWLRGERKYREPSR